jgi:hypothetical protein
MVDKSNADAFRAVEFLKWLNPAAPLYVESMESMEASNARVMQVTAEEVADCVDFVERSNSVDQKRNIYFLPQAEFLQGGRKKANVSAARFLHVDLINKDYVGTEGEQSDQILALLLDAKARPKGVSYPSGP